MLHCCTYLRRKMRQIHITNTSSPNRTAPPTTPAITALVEIPVLSGVVLRVEVGLVVLPIVSSVSVWALVSVGTSVSVGASVSVVEKLVMMTESVVKVDKLGVEGFVVPSDLVVATGMVVGGLVVTLVQKVSSAIPAWD